MSNYWVKCNKDNRYLTGILSSFDPDLWLEWHMIYNKCINDGFTGNETDLILAMSRLVKSGKVDKYLAHGAIVLELFRIKK